ncbi:arsenate reductase (glutaredoxin) [Alphaproteobacteria bacterium]|nr:arsenate reductase (glutaredoxin) [Alphaproteobacteria bacterium]
MCDLTIYHNPRCSKSRQTLEIIRSKGVEPEIVLYLEDVPSADDIADVLRMLDMKPMDIIRKNEAEFKEHFAGADELTDEQLIDLMRLYPKVIERPIVVNKGKAVIGRPPENVIKILVSL